MVNFCVLVHEVEYASLVGRGGISPKPKLVGPHGGRFRISRPAPASTFRIPLQAGQRPIKGLLNEFLPICERRVIFDGGVDFLQKFVGQSDKDVREHYDETSCSRRHAMAARKEIMRQALAILRWVEVLVASACTIALQLRPPMTNSKTISSSGGGFPFKNRSHHVVIHQ
jgi:hypothetical protein